MADLEAILEQPQDAREATLVVLDLDGFKSYNDSFGHPAGDELLARLGRNLEAVAGAGSIPPGRRRILREAFSRRLTQKRGARGAAGGSLPSVTLEDRGTNLPLLSERPAPDGSDIRKLTAADVPVIASALARAFEDDPVMNWVMRDEDMIGRLERAFGFFLRSIWLREDECYANTRLAGAALWLPPRKWQLSPLAQLRLLPGMASVVGRNLPRMMSVLNLIEKNHPKEPPHYYLAVLGVEPELQGRGFGGALMQPVLSMCDRDRTAAYLESSKERNVVLYERHGFRVVEEVHLPKGGPPIWRMWREPVPA